MLQPLLPNYHRLCYPATIEGNLKKELTKQIVIFTITIIFIIVVTCAAVLLTNVFASEALQIAVTLVGIAVPYVFSFLCLDPYNKIIALQKRLKEERALQASDIPSFPKNDEDARAILENRKKHLPKAIAQEKIKKLDISFVAENVEIQMKREFLDFLLKDPKSTATFKGFYTFHFKDYNEVEVTQMVRSILPFCTKTTNGVETKVFWHEISLENPL